MVNLLAEIKSVFDGSGFEEARKAMELMKQEGIDTDLSMDELQTRMNALNADVRDLTDSNQGLRIAYDGQLGTIDDLVGKQGAMAALQKKTGKDMEVLPDILDRTSMRLEETSDGVVKFRDTMTGGMRESASAANAASQQMQRFRFDLLSLMFAGMEATSAMKSLLEPSMDAMGVYDVWSDTLQFFFMPAARTLLNWVLRIRRFLMGLDDDTRDIINSFAVYATAVLAVIKPLTILGMNIKVVAGLFKTLGVGVATAKGIIGGGGGLIGMLSTKSGLLGTIGTRLATVKTAFGKGLAAGIKKALAVGLLPVIKVIGAGILVLGAMYAAVKALSWIWENDFLYIKSVTKEVVDFVKLGIKGLIMIFDEVADKVAWAAGIIDDAFKGVIGTIGEYLGLAGDAADETERLTDTTDDVGGEFGARSDFGSGFDPIGSNGVGQTNIDEDVFINVDGGQFDDGEELADGISSRFQEESVSTFRGR